MLRRPILVVVSLLATGSQAYAPIQMVSGQGRGLVVLPKGFPGSIRGALTPQRLSVRNPASTDSPRSIPYFTAKIDQTITWDDANWCLEATGNKHGDAVRVNSCSGAQLQKWNWIPDGRGHNMIQLTDTELCLDAIDNEVGSNGAPLVLRGCGNEVAQWQFEKPLPLPGTSEGDDFSYAARHVMITLLTLAGLGAVILGARIWQVSATRDQDQEHVSAEMAFASRTSNISMAAANKVTVPNAEEAAKKNPTVRRAAKFEGMKAGDLPTKKNMRNRIMKKKQFVRGGSPFDGSIHKDVSEKMSERFAGELIDEMKQDTFREITMGEGRHATTFVLAKEFGFCWGVERSIELAWAAREAYPGKTMHLTNELIHNPGVNELLGGMDINFLEKDKDAVGGKRFEDVGDGDVVILPAFGASLEEMQLLDSKGVTTVDTTCPWVTKVWTTVDKHERAGMTSLIHGKYQHEEAIATASMCETYLTIKDMKQALDVASYILQEDGCLTDDEFLAKYKHAASPHFHPRKHLSRIGLANQTTMYKKETQAIGRLLEKTMITRYGPENVKEHFVAFDTICDATQVRQDAVNEMSSEALLEGGKPLDFILVVGGWDSSNTAHLLEIPHERGLVGYHVNTAKCIRPDNSIEHRDVDGNVLVTEGFLALDRPMRVGITSGASTPDSVVQECMEALMLVKKLSPLDGDNDEATPGVTADAASVGVGTAP